MHLALCLLCTFVSVKLTSKRMYFYSCRVARHGKGRDYLSIVFDCWKLPSEGAYRAATPCTCLEDVLEAVYESFCDDLQHFV